MPPVPPRLPPSAAARLGEVYAEVDRRIAALGPVCFARGICCDFERVDHVLYASKLETDCALERIRPRTDLPPGRDVCPYLQDGLCGARSVRMLGCRTYFCQEGWEPRGAEVYEWALGQLRQICADHDLGWAYAPALRLLAAEG